MTMGIREKLKGFAEWTIFTGWKHEVGKFEKSGESKKVKRLFNRRIRRNINQHIMDDVVE